MALSHVFLFLLGLACLVGMMLMMRRGGDGGRRNGGTGGDPAVQDRRIADLEGEVARWRGHSAGAGAPELTLPTGGQDSRSMNSSPRWTAIAER